LKRRKGYLDSLFTILIVNISSLEFYVLKDVQLGVKSFHIKISDNKLKNMKLENVIDYVQATEIEKCINSSANQKEIHSKGIFYIKIT